VRPLLAIDWGTSSLRGALLDEAGGVIEEKSWPRGILTVPPGGFRAVFDECFGPWFAQARLALISGMAGSRQGWMEAPYAPCPAGLPDLARALAWVEPGRIAIVPGMSCDHGGVPDVMRGEETQVFGALHLLRRRDATLVLPGTHSKWVRVQGGRIESFRTFMTGEVYHLLRTHSILARTMDAEEGPLDEAAFADGLRHAAASANLLAAAFSARTLALFDRLPPSAAPSYLSGLVIGEELRGQTETRPVVIASPALARRYAIALPGAGLLGSEAAWQGLHAVAQSLP
jgi:2-dehydro-3-deoxygalactonokinase